MEEPTEKKNVVCDTTRTHGPGLGARRRAGSFTDRFPYRHLYTCQHENLPDGVKVGDETVVGNFNSFGGIRGARRVA